MNTKQQLRADYFYKQQLTNLKLQGKRSTSIDADSRAVRRIIYLLDKAPDTLLPTILSNKLGCYSTIHDNLKTPVNLKLVA